MASSNELVAYCGLYCGDCFSYQGKIADLARDLRKELRAHKFDKTAATLAEYSFFSYFKNYPHCYEVLGGLVKLRCKPGCRKGGGNPACKIRTCCQRKSYEGCWECEEFEACDKLKFLEGNHGVAHIKNLRRLQKKGLEAFLAGKKDWYAVK
ncbi:MAG: DUF3795 domain-containing protein [bacterium]